MGDFAEIAKTINDPERLAAVYLSQYFRDREMVYPINPFKMLQDESVVFLMRDFGHLEGVFIPAKDDNDTPMVGINMNRPITRQRFTAAHELCHYFRDSEQQICPIGRKSALEKFADCFASGVLMPIGELRSQVSKRAQNSNIEFDDILEIANYFGVSFESCVFRIAYLIHAVSGNTESSELKKRIKKYKPDTRRQERGFNNVLLYEGLIDSYEIPLRFIPNEFARNVFQNDYVYNDSRMEGVDIDPETAAEIVTDIRLNQKNSQHCTEEKEVFLSIAGQKAIYDYIFEHPTPDKCSVFDTVTINRKLFSYFPHPEFGGQIRQSNTLVLGAKFDTIDYSKIIPELMKVEEKVQLLFEHRTEHSLSSYIENLIKIHHELTVIHPFGDGNGRTLRAFLNLMMVRNGLTPVYVKLEDRESYLEALATADKSANYDYLYEFFFRAILRTSVELTR